MSRQKKAKKDRRPNIPLTYSAAGGGVEMSASAASPLQRDTAQFNYTHIKKDLARIAILAASFILILVALSFFLNK